MNTEQPPSITHRSYPAMAGVLISRFSGIIRTIIINAVFGANVFLDAFNAAFRFPNSLRDLFADGALSAAFMKTLVEEKAKSLEAEKILIANVVGFFLLITGILAIVGLIFAHPFMALMSNQRFIASGGLGLASHLFQLLVFYLPLTMLNAIAMAALGVHDMNFRAMNGSIFLSIGMILGALAFPPIFSHWGITTIYGLAWGALAGAMSQLIYQAYPLYKLKLLHWPCFNVRILLRFPPLKQILYMMAPRALGQGASTIALVINTFFALQISAGAMTYVATAIIIIQAPIGLFGVATGFASLPVLTQAIVDKNTSQFSKLFVDSIDSVLWLALITTLGLALFIVPLYNLIFQHGKIVFQDTLLNSITICAYASGILFASGSKVLINGLYALNVTRYIVYNSLTYLAVNTLLTIFLTPLFGLSGLGLAFGLASAVNFWLNYYLVYYAYRKHHIGLSPYQAGGRHFTPKLLAYSLLTLAITAFGIELIQYFWQNFNSIFDMSLTFAYSLGYLIVWGGAFCFLIFLLTLYAGPKVLRQTCKNLITKIWG